MSKAHLGLRDRHSRHRSRDPFLHTKGPQGSLPLTLKSERDEFGTVATEVAVVTTITRRKHRVDDV